MCYTPVKLKSKYNEKLGKMDGGGTVPCGKCPKCKLRRVNAWVFRLMQEEKLHKNSVFLTLTYSNENVPITSKGFMSLSKRDVQLFMKRLRKNTGCKSIKYYFAGEYGSETFRPHYHAIIFDVDKQQMEKAWGLGTIYCGSVTGASIAYCLKYISKEKKIPLHVNDDRLPEFSLQSINLGINYCTELMANWHQDNMASYVVAPGGHKKAMPRYYRDKIFTDEQKLHLNAINAQIHTDNFDKAVREAGGITQFYRNQFEAVQQYKTEYNLKNKLKRDKL